MQYATCKLQHVNCNKQFSTSYLQQAICNKQFATCNFQHAIFNIHFATCNLQHAICNMLWNKQSATCNLQHGSTRVNQRQFSTDLTDLSNWWPDLHCLKWSVLQSLTEYGMNWNKDDHNFQTPTSTQINTYTIRCVCVCVCVCVCLSLHPLDWALGRLLMEVPWTPIGATSFWIWTETYLEA